MTASGVAFLWHMHQPDYGLPGENRNLLPWVRLHATKAYLDLPWILERHPDVRVVINLSGALLKQLRGYTHGGLTDVWLQMSQADPAALDEARRRFLLKNFFSIHWDRHIRQMPGYARLLAKRGPTADRARVSDWTENELLDLQVLFNLAWMGFAARAESPLVRELVDQGSGFTADQKAELLTEQDRLLRLVLPLYRRLADSEQIEITTTPLYHPILPLIIDSNVAARCAPERPLPRRFSAPQDARWHVEAAAELYEEVFGRRPSGMWPAEGSVSPEVVTIFADAGVQWIASDEDVLMASSHGQSERASALYRPYRTGIGERSVNIVFRDHAISDLIGFTYAHNPPEEAAADLVERLCAAVQSGPDGGLVSVILDGENPWEAYEEDGRPFLDALFRGLATREVPTLLPGSHLSSSPPHDYLEHLHSGSWILANYQIWIGAGETNDAWNLLGQARTFLSERQAEGEVPEAALASMYAAEGSDWFWWYGDDFACTHKAEFDALFRAHVRGVYLACGVEPPRQVEEPIGEAPEHSGVIAPTALIQPRLDGNATSYFCWAGSGQYTPQAGRGSMFRSHRYVSAIHFGFDRNQLYFRIDPDVDLDRYDLGDTTCRIEFKTCGRTGRAHAQIPLAEPSKAFLRRDQQDRPLRRAAFGRVLELAVPFETLGVRPGDDVEFVVKLVRDDIEFVRHPPASPIVVAVPDETFEQNHWVV